jgi:hypothetical protein
VLIAIPAPEGLGELTVEELAARVEAAHVAETLDDLEAVLEGYPGTRPVVEGRSTYR